MGEVYRDDGGAAIVGEVDAREQEVGGGEPVDDMLALQKQLRSLP